MKKLTAAALLLIAAAARAEVSEWKRVPLGKSGFTIEYPAGAEVISRDTTIVREGGGGSWGRDFTMKKWGANMPWMDMVRASYYENWDEHATGLDYIGSRGGGRGVPDFPPIQKRERGGFIVYELGWRGKLFPNEPVNVDIEYILELGKKRFISIFVSCREDSLAEYSVVYRHMRDSLAPAPK